MMKMVASDALVEAKALEAVPISVNKNVGETTITFDIGKAEVPWAND